MKMKLIDINGELYKDVLVAYEKSSVLHIIFVAIRGIYIPHNNWVIPRKKWEAYTKGTKSIIIGVYNDR
jgi:hypothetical protein